MLAGKVGFFRSTTHPEAADWAARVVTNGGSVSASTLSAVSTFCYAIDNAGIRSKFYRLNLFCGTGVAACLVPLYRGQSLTGTQYGNATDTNLNFVAGDYSETGSSGGLKGNGSNKALDTTLPPNYDAFTSRHLSVYENQKNTLSGRVLIGSDNLSPTPRQLHDLFLNTVDNLFYYPGDTGAPTDYNFSNRAFGFTVGNNTSLSSRQIFINGTQVASSTTTAAPAGVSTPTYAVFGEKRATATYRVYVDSRLAGYSAGLGFTSGQITSYTTAMQAFQTALGRNI